MAASTEDALRKMGGFEISVRLCVASSGEQRCVERNIIIN